MRPSEIEILEVQAYEVRPVRHVVLRPGQPAKSLLYPGDDDPATVHLAIRDTALSDRPVVSIASFYLEPVPENVEHALCGVAPGSPGVRIRGMATLEAYRGRGLGRRLVEYGIGLITDSPGPNELSGTLWCNARTTASVYYEKQGFIVSSPLFDIPGIGEHVVMVRPPGL